MMLSCLIFHWYLLFIMMTAGYIYYSRLHSSLEQLAFIFSLHWWLTLMECLYFGFCLTSANNGVLVTHIRWHQDFKKGKPLEKALCLLSNVKGKFLPHLTMLTSELIMVTSQQTKVTSHLTMVASILILQGRLLNWYWYFSLHWWLNHYLTLLTSLSNKGEFSSDYSDFSMDKDDFSSDNGVFPSHYTGRTSQLALVFHLLYIWTYQAIP